METPQFIPWPPLPLTTSLNRKGTNIVLWTEDQELELQRLFEEFQDSDGKSSGCSRDPVRRKLNCPLIYSLSPNPKGILSDSLC